MRQIMPCRVKGLSHSGIHGSLWQRLRQDCSLLVNVRTPHGSTPPGPGPGPIGVQVHSEYGSCEQQSSPLPAPRSPLPAPPLPPPRKLWAAHKSVTAG